MLATKRIAVRFSERYPVTVFERTNRVYRLAFQREDPEDALMNPA
jgi:hypothetical protein